MHKILVIEDDPQIRDVLVELLNAENFIPFAAEHGAWGIQLANEICPDLIICDVMMPFLDGYEVLSVLRQNPNTATIPFIFLTAKTSFPDLRQGMNLGADDYLTKPFTRTDLLLAIDTRLSKQKILTERSEKQINSLCQRISYSLLNKLLRPLDEIEQTSLSLLKREVSDLNTENNISSDGIGSSIYSKTQSLRRAINNLFVCMNISLLEHDIEATTEIITASTMNPADFIVMLTKQTLGEYNRAEDLRYKLENAEINIVIDDLKKVIEEILEFITLSSPVNTVIDLRSNVESDIFKCSFTSQVESFSPELEAQIARELYLSRECCELIDPGLGLMTAQQIASLYRGRLTCQRTSEAQLTLSVLLPLYHI